MTDLEQKKAAKEFSIRWKDKGYEKGESQKYWIDLLENVLGVSNAVDFIHFEDTVHIDKATGFIDGFIDKTKVLIEQKSIDKELRKAHQANDVAVMEAYEFNWKTMTESECVAELMKMYKNIIGE